MHTFVLHETMDSTVKSPKDTPQSSLSPVSELFRELKLHNRPSFRRSAREPTLIHGEVSPSRTRTDRSDHILQFSDITRPGIRTKQIEALFVDRLKALSGLPCETINEVSNQ
jgi:hypothetical protein